MRRIALLLLSAATLAGFSYATAAYLYSIPDVNNCTLDLLSPAIGSLAEDR